MPRSPGRAAGVSEAGPAIGPAAQGIGERGGSVTTMVTARDGRRLAVEVWGAPDGVPVFLLHGTPGSRFGPRPREAFLHRAGVRLIAYDRPGYGGSTRSTPLDRAGRGRRGRDRGHARHRPVRGARPFRRRAARAGLRRAAAERVIAAVSLSRWRRGTRTGWTGSRGGRRPTCPPISPPRPGRWPSPPASRSTPASSGATPVSNLPFQHPDLPESDRRVVADFGIRSMLVSNFAEALKTSGLGWVDNALSFITAWGFDPGEIDLPVLLWHGADDVFSPVGHTLWLAERIQKSTLVVKPGAARTSAPSRSSPRCCPGSPAGVRGSGAQPDAAMARPARTGPCRGGDQMGCGSRSHSNRFHDRTARVVA